MQRSKLSAPKSDNCLVVNETTKMTLGRKTQLAWGSLQIPSLALEPHRHPLSTPDESEFEKTLDNRLLDDHLRSPMEARIRSAMSSERSLALLFFCTRDLEPESE